MPAPKPAFGLFGVVSAETITETLAGISSVDACADQLIELALRAGAPDNVTVVVCDIVDTNGLAGSAQPSTVPQVVGAAATDRLAKTRASHTSGAAGRAARLRPDRGAAHDDDEDKPAKKRRLLPRIIGAVVIAAVLVGGIASGYAWTRTQYYVAAAGDVVAIYRGIPQKIGPVSLSEVYERTDIAVADLPTYAKNRLETPTTRSSLKEAHEVVLNFKTVSRTATPTPSPTPSESPTALGGTGSMSWPL